LNFSGVKKYLKKNTPKKCGVSMGLLTSACDYFHKLREIFLFPGVIGNLKDKAEGFLLCIFSKRNIYLFESVASRLKVIQMPLQGTYYRLK
jgi:hypothetical protein